MTTAAIGRTFLASIAIAGALTGCYGEVDAFNEKAADRICEFNRGHPDEPILDKTTDLVQGDDALPLRGPEL